MSELFIVSAYFNGECEKCGQPTCGGFDSDDDRDNDDNHWCELECVNCHQKQKIRINPRATILDPSASEKK